MLRSRRVERPSPSSSLTTSAPIDDSDLAAVLSAIAAHGIAGIVSSLPPLDRWIDAASGLDPAGLNHNDALAFWINLYNAGTLRAVATTYKVGASSVLRVPGAFTAPWVIIAGEPLTLDNIEHGKIRRFGDPRIHGALICGTASCPTLRKVPFHGSTIDADLDDQMRSFMTAGGYRLDGSPNTLTLSRIFKWYGSDFVHPTRMPTLIPSGSQRVARAAARWMTPSDRTHVLDSSPKVSFAPYDWSLGCSIA